MSRFTADSLVILDMLYRAELRTMKLMNEAQLPQAVLHLKGALQQIQAARSAIGAALGLEIYHESGLSTQSEIAELPGSPPAPER